MQNFFEHQDEARKNTGRLVFLFVLAVIAIIVSIYAVAILGFGAYRAYSDETGGYYDYADTTQYQEPVDPRGGDGKDDEEGGGGASSGRGGGPTLSVAGFRIPLWNPSIFFGVAGFVLLTVGGGSFFKIRSLRAGGSSIALNLGGRLVNPDTEDQGERRLLNVVEEMAIASGVPVPLVFVMDGEDGINAFAAGYTINDAAVAVTRGCIEQLTRDELQGVIAHEFSHILNGDMRLNIRLIGILFGILIIGQTGLWVFRTAAYSGRGRSSRDNPLPLIVIGLLLAGIGYIGLFFGRLIKAAVSRQREYLADASAVQFTRLPDGISGALKKIGGFAGSKVEARQAEELSHMFFSNALSGMMFGGALATHPPLEERIKRVDPSFGGDFGSVQETGPQFSRSEFDGSAQVAGFSGGAGAPSGQPGAAMAGAAAMGAAGAGAGPGRPSGSNTIRINADDVVGQVGAPTTQHLTYSHNIIQAIPQPVRDATHSLLPAIGVVYSLLLDTDGKVRAKQIAALKEHSHPSIVEEALRLFSYTYQLDPRARLPLIEMAIPTLRQLAPQQYEQMKTEMGYLVWADNEVSVFEFALEHVLLHRLDEAFGNAGRKMVRYPSFNPLKNDAAVLLSNLAYAGSDDSAESQRAFRAGVERLPGGGTGLQLLPPDACEFDRVSKALEKLAGTAPTVKQKIVDACAHVVLADEEVTVDEAEMLRAVASTLDAPLPPFLG